MVSGQIRFNGKKSYGCIRLYPGILSVVVLLRIAGFGISSQVKLQFSLELVILILALVLFRGLIFELNPKRPYSNGITSLVSWVVLARVRKSFKTRVRLLKAEANVKIGLCLIPYPRNYLY